MRISHRTNYGAIARAIVAGIGSFAYSGQDATLTWSGGGVASTPSDPVTTALNATGSGTRYDVTSDAQMDAVPWGSLTAGSVVNIFYKATPYLRKLGLRGQGTALNPIIVNGVTDSSGNRPVLQFSGAGVQTATGCNPGGANNVFSATPDFGESLGGIVIKRGPSDGYGTYSPRHIHIKNLEMWGAGGTTGRTYTSTVLGTTQTYGTSAAGIYLLLLKNGLIENCVIYDHGFGIFTQAKDGLISEACEDITVRSCRVYGNGVSGSFFEHNFYVQCARPVIEMNYIGRVRAGSEGSTYKTRSSGEIFRYNYVEGSARVLDFVHSEDQGSDGIVTLPEYGTAYCYGNVLVNDIGLGGYAGNMIHLGGDNLGEDDTGAFTNPASKYMQQLYFFNNTVIYRGQNSSSPYRGAFFDLSLAANNPNTSKGAPSTVDSWNNVYVMTGVSGAPTESCWMEYVGIVNNRGNNLAFGPLIAARTDALTDRFQLNSLGTLLTADPLLTNIASRDYRLLAGSPARGQASTPAAVSAIAAAHPILYQPQAATNGALSRSTVNDLGALEYGVA